MVVLIKIIQVVLALSILVIIHEFGHFIVSKAFGIEASLPFALHHPSVIPTLLRNRCVIKAKRKAATQLSKLTADFLKEVVGD